NIVLVPPFQESEVDTYFGVFERIAIALNWPKDVWSFLLQCKLIGKAQEVFSSLSLEDSLQYEVVKTTILQFARKKETLLDKWCASSKVNDFDSLRELMLLEEFKTCLPDRVVVYLNERKVSSVSEAAVLADEFVLTHKNVF
ncbi:hypothetical protein C0J45_15987, partial [Silurus meridionalis]